jgi:glutamate synthase domain-containing protein 3
MTRGTAIILGSTGRNFAAGMSGGIAFVVDEQGTFPARCNAAMVDLEPLGPTDEMFLKGLIGRHLEYTGSGVAKRVLAEWDELEGKFVKVFPREYRRVLAEQRYDTELSGLATGM